MTVSSKGLAEFIGVNPWQIRKDFSYFGGFGKRGVGYEIKTLTEEIKKILKLNVVHKAALVGVGNLGLAVLAYPGFKKYGFEIAACFDGDPNKVGTEINGKIIEDMSKIRTLRERGVDIAVLAVPRSVAQQAADDLIDVGVKGILKFGANRPKNGSAKAMRNYGHRKSRNNTGATMQRFWLKISRLKSLKLGKPLMDPLNGEPISFRCEMLQIN